jgi:hypothetical protein
VFRYGHQTNELLVLWLDVDEGFHKTVCHGVAFPNARVDSVERFYNDLAGKAGGVELVRKFETLKGLKGTIL